MTNLDVAFNYLILEDEGSKYTNDPNDPGGPTKWGVTKKTYQQFFQLMVVDQEIEQMTALTAKQIYRAYYWIPLCCDHIMDLAIAIAIFDCGVLYGVGTIAVMVQRALSLQGATLKLDGILGDKSINALNLYLGGGRPEARKSLMEFIHGLLYERMDAIIADNPKEQVYRHGWSNRADRLLLLLDDNYLNKYKEEMFT